MKAKCRGHERGDVEDTEGPDDDRRKHPSRESCDRVLYAPVVSGVDRAACDTASARGQPALGRAPATATASAPRQLASSVS